MVRPWELVTGRAVDGPHEGVVLDQGTETGPMFWGNWHLFYSESTVYGQEE